MASIRKKIVLLPAFFIFVVCIPSFAQNKAEIKIKTSAQCDMCKKDIEKKLLSEKGVKKAVVDLSTKLVTITYNSKRTDPNTLRTTIAKAGYDADDMPAINKKSENELKHSGKIPPEN